MKFAFRQLRAAPVFTAIAVTTLALGIGANSAIFALVDATLLRPLPYANPDRLVTIWETSDANSRSFASPPNMLDWNGRSRTFEKIAGFTPNVGGMVMAGRDGNAETVSRQWVTAGIFDVLGVKPIAGRTFLPEDEEKRRHVIVMSESLWESRFNRDPAIVGRDIKMDGILWTVVGVVPKTFEILGRTSVWAMRPFVNMPPRARGQYMLQVVGRMKPGIGISAAQADLSAVADGLAREFPQTNQRPRRAARADARFDDRQRPQGDVDAVSRRRRIRAADLLRQRREPADGARQREDARARGARRARRRAAANHPAAADGESGPVR